MESGNFVGNLKVLLRAPIVTLGGGTEDDGPLLGPVPLRAAMGFIGGCPPSKLGVGLNMDEEEFPVGVRFDVVVLSPYFIS